MVGTSEFRVNVFVDDPFVRFEGSPAGGGHRHHEEEIEIEEIIWGNSYSVRTEFAVWPGVPAGSRHGVRVRRGAGQGCTRRSAQPGDPDRRRYPRDRARGSRNWWPADWRARGARALRRRDHHAGRGLPDAHRTVRGRRDDLGVAQSLSDNGIKVFGHSGFKLPDDEEHEIEQEIFRLREQGVGARPADAARWTRRWSGSTWISCSALLGALDGVRMVMDCGNGASYRLAPELFRRLGAEVVAICVRARTAATSIWIAARCTWRRLQQAVRRRIGADFGVAFDGDADRAIFVSAQRQGGGWRCGAAGLRRAR